MLPAPGEVILIGIKGARIDQINDDLVKYVDMAGQRQLIDLKECATNWVLFYKQHKNECIILGGAAQEQIDAENARCIGTRGHAWIQFMTERKTRFEFPSWEDRNRKIVAPLLNAGWRTFDAD